MYHTFKILEHFSELTFSRASMNCSVRLLFYLAGIRTHVLPYLTVLKLVVNYLIFKTYIMQDIRELIFDYLARQNY